MHAQAVRHDTSVIGADVVSTYSTEEDPQEQLDELALLFKIRADRDAELAAMRTVVDEFVGNIMDVGLSTNPVLSEDILGAADTNTAATAATAVAADATTTIVAAATATTCPVLWDCS